MQNQCTQEQFSAVQTKYVSSVNPKEMEKGRGEEREKKGRKEMEEGRKEMEKGRREMEKGR